MVMVEIYLNKKSEFLTLDLDISTTNNNTNFQQQGGFSA